MTLQSIIEMKKKDANHNSSQSYKIIKTDSFFSVGPFDHALFPSLSLVAT